MGPTASEQAATSLTPEEQNSFLRAAFRISGDIDPDTDAWEEEDLEALEDMEDTLGEFPYLWRRREVNPAGTQSSWSEPQKHNKLPVSRPRQGKESFDDIDGKDVVSTLKSQEAVAVPVSAIGE